MKRIFLIDTEAESFSVELRRPVKPQPYHGGTAEGRIIHGYQWDMKQSVIYDSLGLELELKRHSSFSVGDIVALCETWKVGAWRDNGRMALDYQASPELVHTPWCYPSDDVFERLTIQSYEDCVGRGCKEERIATPGDRYGDQNTFEPDRYRYFWEAGQSPCRWRSPITMPAEFARRKARITSVRVEHNDQWEYVYTLEPVEDVE